MRLIDADELKELRHQYIQGRIKFDGSEYDLIDKCPTIDAVPVVRCKNCKHRGDPMDCPMCHEEYYFDEDDGGDYFTVDQTVDGGFCHAGEMKEDIK